MTTILAQPAREFKSEGRVFTVKTETQSSHAWINGEPVFTDAEVVVVESTNEEGYARQMLTVLPLVDAVALAKAILAQAEAQEDAAIEAQWQRREDYEALVDDHLDHELEIEWIRHGC